MNVRVLLLSMLILGVASPAALSQYAGGGLVVLKFSWDKERIRPRASVSSLASQDELIRQSQRERQLAAARNSSDKGAVTRIETQIGNHDEAVAKARQTAASRDGYRYKVTLRNDGVKTIKSIDWDYLFFDPITQQELARHQFTSDETIKPGKSKEVSVLYLIPPVKTVSARMLNLKESMAFTEQVVIARIQYSDGSDWQRP
jgi:hypothetical protein